MNTLQGIRGNNCRMRIAVCFTGLAYGKTSGRNEVATDCLLSLASIKQCVYQDYDCDTYFHAWIDTQETERNLCALLKPKAYIAEPSREFHKDARHADFNLSKTGKLVPAGKRTNNHNTLSQVYSRSQSINLALKTMKKEGLRYDFIIALRLDLHFNKTIPYLKIRSDVLTDSGYGKHPEVQHGFFFIGSPAVMARLPAMDAFAQEKVKRGVDLLSIHTCIFTPFFNSWKGQPKIHTLFNFRRDFTLPRYLKKQKKHHLSASYDEMLKSELQDPKLEQYLQRNQAIDRVSTWYLLSQLHDYPVSESPGACKTV